MFTKAFMFLTVTSFAILLLALQSCLEHTINQLSSYF